MPFITIKNQKLFYIIQGRNDSPSMSVLLIHGAGGTHLDWPPELRRIADVTAYAIDLPGHGRSDPPGYSSIDLYADFVTSFINTIEIDKVRNKEVLDDEDFRIIDDFVAAAVQELVQTKDFTSVAKTRMVISGRSISNKDSAPVGC